MSNERIEQAWKLLQEAYQAQMERDFDRAVELYKNSLETYPTAEAHTFLGWTYHFQGKVDDAIAECKRAIEVDPEFGNPYNDIGAYLIEQGKLMEAIDWLERATRATRYESYCFPWFNLGRVYEKRYEWEKARECYARALQESSDYQVAAVALKKLKIMWN